MRTKRMINCSDCFGMGMIDREPTDMPSHYTRCDTCMGRGEVEAKAAKGE